MTSTERLIEVGLDHMDNGAVAYSVERLMDDGPWNEDSTAFSTAITLRLHLRSIPAAKAKLDRLEANA